MTPSTHVAVRVRTISETYLHYPCARRSVGHWSQDPTSQVGSVTESLGIIYRKGGIPALWHGTSAGIMKTVPKYCIAVAMKVRYVSGDEGREA